MPLKILWQTPMKFADFQNSGFHGQPKFSLKSYQQKTHMGAVNFGTANSMAFGIKGAYGVSSLGALDSGPIRKLI